MAGYGFAPNPPCELPLEGSIAIAFADDGMPCKRLSQIKPA
jgi:hypothetical protein